MSDDPAKAPVPRWKCLDAMWSAERAEHASVPGYELTAFVLAADRAKGWERLIGWEVHGGAKLLDLIAKGNAATFEDAKTQAVEAWRRAAHALGHSTATHREPNANDEVRPARARRSRQRVATPKSRPSCS